MELIRKTRKEKNKNGYWVYYGEFLCPFCFRKIERDLSSGKRDKSCGCVQYKLASESNTGKKRTDKQKQKIGQKNKGKKHTIKTRQKMSFSKTGEKNPIYGKYGELSPNWNNGSSFEPYSPEFNKSLKQQVLERDEYKCQNPNCEYLSEGLDVHHIDYDKQNNSLDNLTTLCDSCHIKTNGKKKRLYFTEFYQNIMINRIMECLL